MTSVSFLQHRKGTKLYYMLDRALLITYPAFFLIGLYLFDRFIAKLHMTAEKSIFFLLVLIFTLLIFSARALKRDFMDIEKLIIQELKDSKYEVMFATWKSQRLRKGLADIVMTLFLIISPIAAIMLPYDNLLHKYSKEIFITALIISIFVFGIRKLILFNDFLIEIMRLYEGLFERTSTTVRYRPLVSLPNIVISSIGAFFCIILAYLFVPTISLRFLILFVSATWVLLFLAKELYDSYKLFYSFLEQLDMVRGFKASEKDL